MTGGQQTASARRRWFYIWLMPVMWSACCWLGHSHPGDEYGLWAFGSVAGVWIMFMIGNLGGMGRILVLTLAAGACVMTGVGLVMDKLRVRFALWFPLFLAAAVILCIVSVNSYPSYERAIRKNGSLAAYVLFACNTGLYVSVILSVAATGAVSIVQIKTERSAPEC